MLRGVSPIFIMMDGSVMFIFVSLRLKCMLSIGMLALNERSIMGRIDRLV